MAFNLERESSGLAYTVTCLPAGSGNKARPVRTDAQHPAPGREPRPIHRARRQKRSQGARRHPLLEKNGRLPAILPVIFI